VGQAAARKYGVWMIPTIILFDEDGQEVGRQLNLINKI
jgi:thioredoxin-related protein